MAWLGIFLFAGCNNEGQSSPETNTNTDTVAQTAPTVNRDSIPAGCFAQIMKRDTAFLQFDNKDSSINGTLSYNIYEKDRNDGTVQADVKDGIVSGWYIFKSEGTVSVREVAWKIHGNELWPAMGKVMEKQDTARFAEPDRLQYDSLRPFKKVECVI